MHDVDMDAVDFSDASNNDEANSTDEEAFSAMDGFQSGKSSKRRVRRVKHSSATDLHDSLDEELDSDDDVSPRRKSSRPSTSNLFASAEELGRMYYASQDVPKRPFHPRTGGKHTRANKGPKHRRPPSSKRQRWNAGQNTSQMTKKPRADRCEKKKNRAGCK
ncbi:unnamed protein product [Dicrocoelium dendriticum]|nr:unnamed protein product [Dicrocoelium dendriticum]